MTDFFDRNGHMTELSLERFVQGEINSPEIEAHLESCEICRRRLAAIRADNSTSSIKQPTAPPRQTKKWNSRLLAAAAAIIFAVGIANYRGSPPADLAPLSLEPDDTFRIKGGFQLDFFRQRNNEVNALYHGATVQVDDKVGFKVRIPRAGYLLIAGIDDQKTPYLCFPQNQSKQSRRFEPSSQTITLDEAVVFDTSGQSEDLIALLCEDKIGFMEVTNLLKGASRRHDGRLELVRPGCQIKTIKLKKKGKNQP